MNLLQFSQQNQPTLNNPQALNLPVTIIWPAVSPVEAMPAGWRRLDDGCLQVTYTTKTELRQTIEALSLVKEARDLGGILSDQPQPEARAENAQQLFLSW